MPEYQQTKQSKKSDSIFRKQVIFLSQTHKSNPESIIQHARINPKSLTHADVMQLQRTIGNRAVGRLLSGIGNSSMAQQATVQRQEIPEEEELRQGKMIETVQMQEIPEEEDPLQTKSENNPGMPDNLKAGVENLSGIDMSDVRVHYNSEKSAEVGASAYTQGTDIHVAPGQERHLSHDAWHVVQQAQSRVKQVIQMKKESEIETELERGSQEMSKKKISDLVQKKTDGEDLTVKYDDSSILEDWEGTTQRGNEIHFLSRHGPANSSEGYLRGRIIAQIDLFEQYRGEKIAEENRRIDTISGRAENRGFNEAKISGEFGEFVERDEAHIQMNAARENIRKLESIVSGSDEMFAQLERWAKGETFKDRLRNSYHGSGVPSKVASSFKRVEDMEQAAYDGIAENLDKLNGEINNDADPSAFPDKFKPVRVNQNIDILAVQMRNGIEIVTNRVTNVPVTLYYVSSQNAPDYTDYTVPLVVQTGYPEVPDV